MLSVDEYVNAVCGHNSVLRRLLRPAVTAAMHAYCPYSKFQVGAAIYSSQKKIYSGCNVENVMYNGMSHAELTAISAGITAEGPTFKIREMVIWTPTNVPTPSCGGCRQLIREHALDMEVRIWSFCKRTDVYPVVMTLEELLPESFGPEMIG